MMVGAAGSACPLAHSMDPSEVLHSLAVSLEKGLTEAEAMSRLRSWGPNAVNLGKGYSAWGTFVAQFRDPQMLLLFGAAVLSQGASFLQRRPGLSIEASFITVVALGNALLGFIREHRANKEMQALRELTPARARVLRDGEPIGLLATKLVPGDILLLYEGSIIPADARLVQSSNLVATEASLTGESGGVAKGTVPVAEDTPLAERVSMLFAGTSVISGTAKAVVVATGTNTELGKIVSLVQGTAETRTPLQMQIASLSRALAIAAILLALLLSAVFLLLSQQVTVPQVTKVLIFSISLAVAATPEALATIITLTIALAARRLARRGAIVRRMSAIETLGAANVILCDKTGTVTLNCLAVHSAVTVADLRGGGEHCRDSLNLLHAAALASADFEGPLARSALVSHDALDRAIWRYIEQCPRDFHTRLAQEEILGTLPFTSDRKLMSVLAAQTDVPSSACLYVKGAPEVVLQRCVMAQDRERALTVCNQLASEGLKVIAVAMRPCSPVEVGRALTSELERDLTFLGLLTFEDPIRPNTKAIIGEASRAGVRTILITGDHPAAARFVSKQIGIPHADTVLTGKTIDSLSDDEFSRQLKECNVLARVLPSHKARAAKLLQSAGDVVAMTGDGVNDAPALKQANVGIALGSGTDLAKEAADIILTKDDLGTILIAINEGRLFFSKVRTATVYLLASNLSEVLILSSVAVLTILRSGWGVGSFPLPLTANQILWINLATDTVPALALSLTNTRLPNREMRSASNSMLLGRSQLLQIGSFSLLIGCATLMARFWCQSDQLYVTQTVTVTTLVFSQAFFALSLGFAIKGISASWGGSAQLTLAVFGIVLLQTALLLSDWGRAVIGLTPLTMVSWTICLLVSFLPLIANGLIQIVNNHWSIAEEGSASRAAAE